jgi:hypothetical protein
MKNHSSLKQYWLPKIISCCSKFSATSFSKHVLDISMNKKFMVTLSEVSCTSKIVSVPGANATFP